MWGVAIFLNPREKEPAGAFPSLLLPWSGFTIPLLLSTPHTLRVCGVVSVEATEPKQTTEPISCGVDIMVNPSRVVSFSFSPRLKLGFVNPLKNRGEEGMKPHEMGSMASIETTPHTLRMCGVVSIKANEAKQTTEPISCGVDIKVPGCDN
ncbi:hypothetical protein LXL04_029474 [Taraxacum kok-saghyz]